MSFNVTLQRNSDGSMNGYYPTGDKPGWEITDLAAVANDPDEINLTWTATGTVDVQWFPPASLGGNDWQTIAAGLTGGSYTHTGVANSNDDNSYRLKQDGVLDYSNDAYANTSPVSGGGTTDLAQIFRYDDFEGGTVGDTIGAETGFVDILGTAKSTSLGLGTSKYSTTRSNSGTQSIRNEFQTGDVADVGWRQRLNFSGYTLTEGDEVWLRYAQYLDTGWEFNITDNSAALVKWNALEEQGGSAGRTYISPKQSSSTTTNKLVFATEGAGATQLDPIPGTGDDVIRGAWQLLEFRWKLGASSNGEISVWIDGVRTNHEVNLTTMSAGQTKLDAIQWATQWNNGVPKDQVCYIDDWAVAIKTAGTIGSVRDDTVHMATDANGNPYIGTAVTSATTILFEDTLASGFDAGWNTTNASRWSAEAGYARITYDYQGDGNHTGGTQLRYNMAGLPRELYISFDIRHGVDTGLGSKTLKVFGQNIGGNYSNVTFGQGYSNGNYDGASYGNSSSGPNDTQRIVRYNGTAADTRSTPNFVYNRGSHIGASLTWRRFQIRWKQNTDSGTADGEFQMYMDGVLQVDVRNLFNRGDDSTGFEYLTFGDYTAEDLFHQDYRNIVISTGGWKAGDEP